MSKHTTGPWQFVTEDRERKIIADGHTTMCDTSYYPWCPSNDADWRLIAAAPELLAQLEFAVGLLKDTNLFVANSKIIKSMLDVIAKATGEQS